MRFSHSAHPGRCVRLAYCLNLHPADTLEGLLAGLRTITLPLRERLAPGREFGVGMYAPAQLVDRLLGDESADRAQPLGNFLRDHGLDPFTWNAFPYGGFGEAGLKARVFEPNWLALERRQFTANVATLASRLTGPLPPERHISISTHTGWHSSRAPSPTEQRELHGGFHFWGRFAGIPGEQAACRTVLALEPEPRANCNDTRELAALQRAIEPGNAARNLGTCLDTCHAAVEFEDPAESLERSTQGGVPLGKLQFTSALCLRAERRSDLDALLALDEPRYLHQVTARAADGALLRCGDLPELRAALDAPGGEAWWRDSELRCHFHVPVDLERLAGGALTTTRAHADATLAAALAAPERWGTQELHVEIETYTWDVLPRAARGPGELVDGLEREYAHVLARLDAAGWKPA